MINLLVQCLALARLLRLCVNEDGPYGVLEKFRRAIGVNEYGGASNELGGLFTCHWCLGIWLAPIIFVLYKYSATQWIVYVLAVAQGGSLVNAIVDRLMN